MEPNDAAWRLHRFIIQSQPHHSQEIIMAALDDLNAIATALEAIPAKIASAETAAIATSEANLAPVITTIQTNLAAINAVLPAS